MWRYSFVIWSVLLSGLLAGHSKAQDKEWNGNNVVWNSQSKNSGASMPCGAGDIGLNVWVEKGELLFYMSRSGTFDANNTLLKLGRMRVKLSPNPFEGNTFRQELVLKDGYVKITGSKGKLSAGVQVWVDVFNPVIHVDVTSNANMHVEAGYESWRFADRITKGKENNQNSYKWAPQGLVKTAKDSIAFSNNSIVFYHQVKGTTAFDITVKQQGLENYKAKLFNPLNELVFGGAVQGKGMIPGGYYDGVYEGTPFKGWKIKTSTASRSHSFTVALQTKNSSLPVWKSGLEKDIKKSAQSNKASRAWWNAYWERSYIFIHSEQEKDSLVAQASKNYQLFRYMLGCNAFGKYPTKFNGGLFTTDPALTDSTLNYTPDFRNWGGGTHTAQNQRLVYWPMLKSGDVDMMRPQFDFYEHLLKNAELRTSVYWGHNGASFTEQLENFGLPNPAEYGWKRPVGYDMGMEYNAWLEYEWDTVLEFCMMMLETESYAGKDLQPHLPFIESCLTFFDEHYTYLAKKRGSKGLDANGHLVLYPGSAAETYKMTYNSTSTIAALKTVLNRLLEWSGSSELQKKTWQQMLQRIPPINFREFNGHPTISPAKSWERVNNTESPQLYPVFPWGIYGLGKPGLDTAINTFKYDPDVLKFKSHIGWKQDAVFAARLGLTSEASILTLQKLKDSGRRFPAFWGPGFDWVPDHNWGGSGMIALQEMLLQSNGRKIYLFPSWPKEWNVHFKLHAPYQTTIEGVLKDGTVKELKVIPESRRKDIELWIK
ncbi:DUF5703 domain-containing protein [Pedobacter sp. MC2016-14]|uniref:DUF5703 domain-containing protein n=1 Tax=Pedobacter sp. MC2016-14 TaxID=2897327 RepID=UPI001E4DEF9D|nr:DUF5703 domain-containing protein [Pedobacter sp. MC2016-14]MCD0489385.1 DUF5703 domain-containing protein [Pedobacter sp. MC2016-14]